jgi:hypothetical protein
MDVRTVFEKMIFQYVVARGRTVFKKMVFLQKKIFVSLTKKRSLEVVVAAAAVVVVEAVVFEGA